MTTLASLVSLSRMLHAVLLSSAALMAMPVNALVVLDPTLNSTVNVRLFAPGGTTLGDLAIDESALGVDTSVGLIAGDTSNPISGFWMLSPESITFVGSSILLRLAGGDENGGSPITGYLGLGADRARYEISGLPASGFTITGFGTSVLSGITSGVTAELIGGNQINFHLDNLQFDPGHRDTNGFAWGEVSIDLITQPVPEPATWALIGGGLLLVGAAKRARRGG